MRGQTKGEIANVAGVITATIFIGFAILIIKFAPAIISAIKA